MPRKYNEGKMKKLILISLFNMLFINWLTAQDQKTKIKLSFSEKIRLTAFNNAITLNNSSENWTFARYISKFGVNYALNKHMELKAVLGNESRIWLSPKVKESNFGEIYFDQLYIKLRDIAGSHLSLTLGRQNIMLDEGFICLDGQPLTGSRSAYFNALRADYRFNSKNTLTAFASYIPQTDNLLPRINENTPSQNLEEQANTGAGLYYRTNFKNSKLSLYYFYKQNYRNDKYTKQSMINTSGVRLQTPLFQHFSIAGEAALQAGKTAGSAHKSGGGYAHLDYLFKKYLPVLQSFSIGAIYLSGDNPATAAYEAWNPLWSRWPKWSESYIYTQILENKGKVAYWTNMASLNAIFKGRLSKNVTFITSYYYLWALEDNLSDFCSGTGLNRGELFILKVKYHIDKNWSGHFIYENFRPGNFYPATADGYDWFRFQLAYKIGH